MPAARTSFDRDSRKSALAVGSPCGHTSCRLRLSRAGAHNAPHHGLERSHSTLAGVARGGEAPSPLGKHSPQRGSELRLRRRARRSRDARSGTRAQAHAFAAFDPHHQTLTSGSGRRAVDRAAYCVFRAIARIASIAAQIKNAHATAFQRRVDGRRARLKRKTSRPGTAVRATGTALIEWYQDLKANH